jgi:very-short-patch-repair endonuclease
VGDEPALYAEASRTGGVVSAAVCERYGFSRSEVSARCRTGAWTRLARGAYLIGGGDPSPATAIRAAVESFGPHAVAGFQSAAALWGIGGAWPTPIVHVIVPGQVARPRRMIDLDIRPHQTRLHDDDVTEIDGIRVTTPARTVFDLVLILDRLSAVSVVDSALNRGLITEDDVEAMIGAVAGRRGAVKAREFLGESDGRAESPLETRVRLRSADGKVAPDRLQVVIYTPDGDELARVDFMWSAFGLVGEADGVGPHSVPDALFNDRDRQNALMAAGFQMIRFTWQDTLTPARVPAMIRAALRAPRRQTPRW